WATAPVPGTTGANRPAVNKSAMSRAVAAYAGAPPNVLETAAILTAAAVIGVLAFRPLMPAFGGPLHTLMPYPALLGFLIVVPLLTAALRGNQRDAATAALIFCCIAGVSAGLGSSADLNSSLVLLLALAVTTSLVPLILGAAILAHRDTEA